MGGDIVLPDSIDGDVAHTGEVVIKGQPSPAKLASLKAADSLKYADSNGNGGEAEEGLVEAKCPNLFKVGYVGLPRGPEFPIAEDISTCTFSQIIQTVKAQRDEFASLVKERLRILEAQSSESVPVGSSSPSEGLSSVAGDLRSLKAKDGKPDDPVFYLSATNHARVRKLLEVFWKASPKAPAKTPLSLLYDYAMRTKADVLFTFGQADEEPPPDTGSASEKLSGNTGFSVSVRLVSTVDKQVIATGTGVMSNKKTAKQLAAASCIEALLSQGVKASAFTDKASKPVVAPASAAATPSTGGAAHPPAKGGKGGKKGESGKGGNNGASNTAYGGGRYASTSMGGYSSSDVLGQGQYPNGGGPSMGAVGVLGSGKGVGGRGSAEGGFGKGAGRAGLVVLPNKRDFASMEGAKGLGKKGAAPGRIKGQGRAENGNAANHVNGSAYGTAAEGSEWKNPPGSFPLAPLGEGSMNGFKPQDLGSGMSYVEMYDHAMKPPQRSNGFVGDLDAALLGGAGGGDSFDLSQNGSGGGLGNRFDLSAAGYEMTTGMMNVNLNQSSGPAGPHSGASSLPNSGGNGLLSGVDSSLFSRFY